MNTNKIANKIAALSVAGVLAITLAGCNSEAVTDTRNMGADSAPSATPAPVESVEPEVEVTEEPSIDDLPEFDHEVDNFFGIPQADIIVGADVDEMFGEGAGQDAARDGLTATYSIIAADHQLHRAHTEVDQSNALAGWMHMLSPEAYAEIEDDFLGSPNTITAWMDGKVATVDGVDYMMGDTLDDHWVWTATSGADVRVVDGDKIGVRFNARIDAPTSPKPVSAEYEFLVILTPGEEQYLIDDLQYEVPNGVVVGD